MKIALGAILLVWIVGLNGMDNALQERENSATALTALSTMCHICGGDNYFLVRKYHGDCDHIICGSCLIKVQPDRNGLLTCPFCSSQVREKERDIRDCPYCLEHLIALV